MTDWEEWLRSAARRPSDHETTKRDKTESEIRYALADYEPLRQRKYRIYAKGSYANNTNVRLNFDVDIAVEYFGFFYSDLAFDLKGKDQSLVGLKDSDDPYTRDQFKSDIREALHRAFGEASVSDGNIAYRVHEGKTTLPADVVPCWEYRRYDRIVNGNPVCHVGSRVYPKDGGFKNNFPKIQLENGRLKTAETNRRYKRMVRGLKKLQTKMVADGVLDEELASYLTESVVYNVPSPDFNHSTYLADMRAVLAHVFNQTLPSGDWNDWHEVHELAYLFRGGKWNKDEVHAMAGKAWDYLGFQ